MHDAQLAKRAPLADQPGQAGARGREATRELAVCGSLLIESDSPLRLRLFGDLDVDSALDLDAAFLAPRLHHAEPPLTLDLAGLVEIEPRALRLLRSRQQLALQEGAYLLIRLSAAQAVHVL